LSLPKDSLICSYNQFFKIDPRVLNAWMRILKAVPTAKLILVKFLFYQHSEKQLRAQVV
jgi:predicted O-linked N-acetylglucosamine transferase (SPINDLY family)